MNRSIHKWLFALTLLLISNTCSAIPLPCLDPMKGNWCIEGSLDGVYMRPCSATWEYGFVRPAAVDGVQTTTARVVKPDYGGGFKAQVGCYSRNGCDFIALSWTNLRIQNVNRRNEPDLFIFVGDVEAAVESLRAELRFDYNRANLRLGRSLGCMCNSRLYGYLGLMYLDITKKRRISAQENATDFIQNRDRTQFDGWGLEVGLGAEHGIGCGFNVVAEFGIFGAAGDRKYDQKSIIDSLADPVSKVRYPTHVVCVPGFDFKLAINYSTMVCCARLTGELGYRGDYYYNSILTTDPNQPANSIRPDSIGFAGPYVGLKLIF